MAELTTLARPYAKAAFEYAETAEQLDAWSQALRTLAAVIVDPKVSVRLSDPLATAEQHAQTLMELMGSELDPKVQNYIRNLATNKRLPLLAEISGLFDLMKANSEQILDVKISSAFELSDAQKSSLSDALSRNLQRKVTLECNTDAGLIGGVTIHAGDTLIDGSVKGRLAKLNEAIASR